MRNRQSRIRLALLLALVLTLLGAALTMECDCESVSFIANLLDEMEDGRMTVQNDRFIFLTVNVKDFLFFCDACERLIDDLQ